MPDSTPTTKKPNPFISALKMVAAPIIGVLAELAMLLVYFCVFLPVGLLLRIIGRDALRLKMDRQAATYWEPKDKAANLESYHKQS